LLQREAMIVIGIIGSTTCGAVRRVL